MLCETPYLNDRTRCKFSGSFPQGKPFMNMDTQRVEYTFHLGENSTLTHQGTFFGRAGASSLFEGPCDLISAGFCAIASLIRIAVGLCCISTVRSKVIRDEHQ